MADRASKEKSQRRNSQIKSHESTDNGKSNSSSFQNGGENEIDRGTSCFACSKAVTDKDKALQCDCCNYWHHINCEKVSALTYKNLISMKESGVKWYCRKCNVGVQCVLTQIVILNQKQKETEDRLGYVEEKVNELDSIEERLKNVEAKLEKPNSYADAVKKDEVCELVKEETKDSVEKLVEERTQKTIKDLEDKVRRQTNLIIFNLPDSVEETEEEKVSEDNSKIELLLSQIGVRYKPVASFRLKGPANKRGKDRPMKVVFRCMADRDDVLKAFSEARRNKKDKDNRLYTQISVRRDLTKAEREVEKKLYEELKQKQEEAKASGDHQIRYVRRKGKIIKIVVPVIQREDSGSESEDN